MKSASIEKTRADGTKLTAEIIKLIEAAGYTVKPRFVYGDGILNFTLKCQKAGLETDATTEGRTFLAYEFHHGLPPQALGAMINGGRLAGFQIVGYNARASKAPIMLKREGKSYKAPIELVKHALDCGYIKGCPAPKAATA